MDLNERRLALDNSDFYAATRAYNEIDSLFEGEGFIRLSNHPDHGGVVLELRPA